MTASSVVELRRYALHPGRDEFLGLCDRESVESQEACGIALFGQFLDLDARLLRPLREGLGFADDPASRPPADRVLRLAPTRRSLRW